MRRSSCTISTMRRPAMRASTRRRESTAGIAALVGSPMPSASTIDAIVDAVPIVMQWPAERDMHDSTSTMSASLHLAGLEHLGELPHVRARADVLAAELAVEHRPAGDADGRQVARRRAHQQRRRGLVAAHQQHDAVERIGADRLLDVHRGLVAEQHRRRAHQRLAEAHHRKLDREAARVEHAVAHVLARARGSARCTAWPPTTCCRCRSPAGRRTGRAECPGSSSTSGGRARRGRGGRTSLRSGARVSVFAAIVIAH